MEILQADLADLGALAQVEARPGADARIGVLINNAGDITAGTFLTQSPEEVARIININA